MQLENLENSYKHRNYKELTPYFLGLLRQNLGEAERALLRLYLDLISRLILLLTWIWQVLYALWPQFCLPALLGKEPGQNLIFALTDCFACRSSSFLILSSADGSGENAWDQRSNRQWCTHFLQPHLCRHHPEKPLLLKCECDTLSLQRPDTLKFVEI